LLIISDSLTKRLIQMHEFHLLRQHIVSFRRLLFSYQWLERKYDCLLQQYVKLINDLLIPQ